MKRTILLPAFFATVLLFSSYGDSESKKEASKDSTATQSAATDLTQVRADIVAIEKQWADALNKRDINALMALYADDAISMPPGEPMLTGKAAIQKQQEEEWKKPAKYASVAFETLDVYAQGDVVTEIGKTMNMDSTGKTVSGGKYMVVFQKKDGKYVCIREIFNSDSKEK